VSEKEWTIDTNILMIASDGEADLCLSACSLLDHVLRNGILAVDVENDIRTEYERNVVPRSHAAKWLAMMTMRGGFTYVSGRLMSAQDAKLAESRFDPADRKFVGVALKTDSKFLVAEESDFWEPNAERCIKGDLGVILMRIDEALEGRNGGTAETTSTPRQ
jgi:hypothetical protein